METIFKKVARSLNQKLINVISQKIFSQDLITDFIIEEIQKRLYDTGIDANNKILRTNLALKGKTKNGFYSVRTERIKKITNQTITHVTLNDTGEFYKTWSVNAYKTFYQLKANFKKDNGLINDNFSMMYNKQSFENAILKMTDDEIDVFINNLFIPYFVQNFKLELWKIIKQER